MVKAKMTWAGGLRFEGTSAFGHKVVTDGSKADGGDESGYKPSEMLLFSLAGCTGIDVVRILEKQKQELRALEIELVAQQPEQYPRPLESIEVRFIARGKNLDPQKVARAIELSEQKYCTVGLTLQNRTKIVSSYKVINE
ncbi:MAG: OsmC family protein [candidate division Zixibacteria bacterium]|nr:OsmC family protein [candidate division Zixibacteria bacterium]